MLMRAEDNLLLSPQSRLYDLFLRFNRRLLFILGRINPPLNTNESHLLGELYKGGKIIARDFARLLSLPKSSVSRSISSLEKKGFLAVTPSTKDKRFRTLILTELGHNILEQDLDLRNIEVDLCMAPLSAEENSELHDYLKLCADNLKAPTYSARESDDPMLQQIRRLTRAMGFIGDYCLGTELPVERCQVIHLLLLDKETLPLRELSRRLPYQRQDFLRLISTLKRLGLVKKVASPEDKRRLLLSLTKKGHRLSLNAIADGETFFMQATRGLSHEQLDRFLILLEKFLYSPLQENYSPAGVDWDFRLMTSSEELTACRAFLIETLSKTGLQREVPPTLISPENLTFALIDKTVIRGVLEVSAAAKDGHQVINFLLTPELRDGSAGSRLLAFALDYLRRQSDFERLKIPSKQYALWVENELLTEKKEQPVVIPAAEIPKFLASLA